MEGFLVEILYYKCSNPSADWNPGKASQKIVPFALGGYGVENFPPKNTHCSKETVATNSDLELKRLFFSESVLLIKDFPKISFTSL